MKKSILVLSALLISLSGISFTLDSIKHDTAWKVGGMVGVNFGQASFTNWAAGGQNSLSVGSLLTLHANYKKGNNSWDNSLELAYGMLQVGSAPLQKNEDKIDFSSMYGHKAFKQWNYAVLLNFKSQFANGYNYPNDSVVVSHFMAPAYVVGSMGMDYKTKDNHLSFYLSPVTSKTTIVNDQRLANEGAYGVKPAQYDTVNGVYGIRQYGQKVLYQFGGYLKFAYRVEIFKNVTFATKLDLFSNYLKDPQNIVVNWENILTMKVNKFLVATVSTNMIYDNNVPVPVTRTIDGISVLGTGPRLQFKEVLAVGVSYKF